MTRIVARLDPPSDRSFAMSPLVIENNRRLEVTGLSSASSHRGGDLQPEQLDDLVAAGHAARADAQTQFAPGPKLVGLWIGNAFEALAAEVGVPVPPLAIEQAGTDEPGKWGVTTITNAWRYLDLWIGRAFSRFLQSSASREKEQIAKAMRWALPFDLRTLAASWSIAADKTREMAWQQRVAPGASDPSFQERINALLESGAQTRDPLSDLTVIAFSGGSGTQRDALVRALATNRGWGHVSFKDAIEGRVSMDRPSDKRELMRLGQILVDTVAMTLVTEVLGLAAIQAKRIVVIDSVRHVRVLGLLQWLAPRHLKHVAITANQDVRFARLRDRSLVPEEILRDPTERELAELEQRADAHFEDNADPIAVGSEIAALAT